MTDAAKTDAAKTVAAKTVAAKAEPAKGRTAKAAAGAAKASRLRKVATPWGAATVVERLSVPQRAGEKRFASVLELVELGGGERLVRIAYTTDGQARRGPVTLRLRDLARLRDAAGRRPQLAAILGGEGA